MTCYVNIFYLFIKYDFQICLNNVYIADNENEELLFAACFARISHRNIRHLGVKEVISIASPVAK